MKSIQTTVAGVLTLVMAVSACGDDGGDTGADDSSTSGSSTAGTSSSSTSASTSGSTGGSTGGSTSSTNGGTTSGSTSSTSAADDTTPTDDGSTVVPTDTGTGSEDATAGETQGTESEGGTEGESTTGGPEFPCTGCVALYVPLAASGTWTEFEINYGDNAAFDLSETLVTYRYLVETEGDAGAVQFYAKNGSRQGYDSIYRSWTGFASASTFIEVTLDLTDLAPEETTTGTESESTGDTGESESTGGETGGTTGGAEESGSTGGSSDEGGAEVGVATASPPFDVTDVVYVGLQVIAGGGGESSVYGPTTVYLDSITFSTDVAADVTFDSGLSGIGINNYNSPVSGSTVTHIP